MPIRCLLLASVVLGAISLPLAGRDIAIIANLSVQVSEISAVDLRAVFLGTKTSLRGAGGVQPVLIQPGPVLAEFCSEYLGKSESALRTYYRSLVFTGKWSMPLTFTSDAEVVAYVAQTRGAIGFVSGESVTSGVRTLKVK